MDLNSATQIINTVPDASVRKALQTMIADQIAYNAARLVTDAEEAAVNATLETRRGLIEDAMNGDMAIEITPADMDIGVATSGFTINTWVSLLNSSNSPHLWCNQSFATTASIATDSAAGGVTIPSTTLTFVNGVAPIVITADAADWLAEETITLTIADISILGFTVTGGTFVATLAAD
jgi:hypothetical protein